MAQIPYHFRGGIGRDLTAVRARPDYMEPTFLLECLLSKPMFAEMHKMCTVGTIFDSLNVKNIESLSILVPPLKIIKKFETIGRPLRFEIEVNLFDIRVLTEMRNAVLSKLMSGSSEFLA